MIYQLLKTIIFLFTFSIPLKVYSQIELPNSIEIIYYIGGDYREDTIKGAYSDKDSVTLNISKDKKSYLSKRSTHIHEIRPFYGDKFQSNINPNSKITRFINTAIKSSEIERLIQLIDKKNYVKYISIDTIRFDSTYIPRDFSLKYYDIDTSNFSILFQYYEQESNRENNSNLNRNTHPDSIQYDKLLQNLIELSIEDFYVTSYLSNISVKLIYEEESIKLFQDYPGEFNTEWSITNSETKSKINILNPKINEIISKILPSKFSRNYRLLKFRDKESIYEQINRE